MLGALSGCEKEKIPLLKQETEVDIFSHVGSNPLIQQIARSLQQHGDTAAYRKTFVQEYGVPLWTKAKCLEQGGTYTAIVPLQEYGRSYLQGLWIFTIKDGKMRYNVAVNDACMPYYEAFKPFFCGIEQSLFNVRRDSIRYKEVVDRKKNGFWIDNTYCIDYSVAFQGQTIYYQRCYSNPLWVQLDDQHFPVDNGSSGTLDLPSTGIGSTGTPDPKPEVDTSDASFRNTKAACILAKLLGKTNTSMYDPSTVVGKLLKDYWGKTAAGAHNLKFVVSPSSMLVSGSTHAQCETVNGSKDVTIRISKEYMESCSNVELARTLIHESIHAEIYVRMQGLSGGVSTDADFARLFEQYKTYGDQRDHNIMAESDYVNLIAQGLKAYHDAGYMAEFDANVGKVYGEDFDSQKFYSMMAWIGLEDSKEFNLKKNDKVWHSDYLNYNKASGMCDLKDCK